MPDSARDVVTEELADLHRRLAELDDGDVAAYIPQLAAADPASFGLALVSMDGHCYRAGSADVPFTIQSVSKPFVYALALAELGLEHVLRYVGVEPSGEAFNAISLEPGTGRPANPMVNAGAIATTALIPAATPAERFERVLAGLGRFAGRRLDVDEDVYRSECDTGDRNQALAHLMRAAGSLAGDPVEAARTYFRQCAVLVTAADLGVMAATLANGGTNPVTGETVIPEPVAVQVLAVMTGCGMYDAAGDWLLRVGLPAKSGVSGGLLAASPARFGVAAYSPPLDAVGNPVRGVAAFREFSERFGLHLMHSAAPPSPTVFVASTVDRAVRQPDSDGWRTDRLGLVRAHGALDFTAAERVLFALREVTTGQVGPIVLDLTGVTWADSMATGMLQATLDGIRDDGHQVALVAGPEVLADDGRTTRAGRLRFAEAAAAFAWAESQGYGMDGAGER